MAIWVGYLMQMHLISREQVKIAILRVKYQFMKQVNEYNTYKGYCNVLISSLYPFQNLEHLFITVFVRNITLFDNGFGTLKVSSSC